jgi:hypothetical protein
MKWSGSKIQRTALRDYGANRVRHDLLPALRRVRPHFERELLDMRACGREWRRDVEALVALRSAGKKRTSR